MEKLAAPQTMMASSIRICLLLAFLSLYLHTCAASWFGKVHVTIANELGGDLVLTAHCYSRDDDLGFHTLPLHASFEFSFRHHFVIDTKFTCSFEWTGNLHWYKIYDHDRDTCKNCSWIITPTGPCMHNFDAHSLNCYYWPNWLLVSPLGLIILMEKFKRVVFLLMYLELVSHNKWKFCSSKFCVSTCLSEFLLS